MGNFIIFIILVSIIVIIFQNKLAALISKTGIIDKFAEIINYFLFSKTQRKWWEQNDEILNSNPEKIKQHSFEIIEKYGRKYKKTSFIQHDLLADLPSEVKIFFSKFDYLNISENVNENNFRIVEKRRLRKVIVANIPFYIIGFDRYESTYFLCKPESSNDPQIYGISKEEMGKNVLPKVTFKSWNNFICYYFHNLSF